MTDTDRQPDSFEALLRPHLDRLYRLAYRLTGTVSDAEDLVQDVLLKVYGRRAELTSLDALGPWLCRVLYNRFVDLERRYRRRRMRTVTIDANTDGQGGEPVSALPGPDAEAERRYDISRLDAGLAELSLEHRAVLLMHDSEGYKLSEIQTITGIALGTLKSRLHRARARLRELLDDDGTF